MKDAVKQLKEISRLEFLVAKKSTDSMFDRGVYRTGDGDVLQPRRPGSMDHLKWKSHGLKGSTLK